MEYAGDSFEYIAPTGEIVVLVLGAAIWLGYVLLEARYLNGDSLQRILWFTFWMGQLNKSVRSPHLTLLGNGAIALIGLILLVQSMRKTTLRFDLLVPYLMAAVLLYTGATLLWHHDARNLKAFFIGVVLWCAALSYFRSHGQAAFLDHVFSGFGWLVAYVAVLVLAFELFLPGDTAGGMGVAGPFRPNSLARNAFVLLIGLFYRHFVLQDLRPAAFYVSCLATLVLNFLTFSRSGMAMPYLFLLGNLRALTRSQRHAVVLLTCAVFALVLINRDFTTRLEHRFFETDDGGRLEGIRAVLGEGQRELLWGHGFMKSTVEDFQSSHSIYRERGYSSHCYFASVFYDFGIAGSVIYATLAAVVLCRLYRLSRLSIAYRFALMSYVCFLISGLFENSSWWPITPLGFLATLMIVMASGATRRLDVDASEAFPTYPMESVQHVEPVARY